MVALAEVDQNLLQVGNGDRLDKVAVASGLARLEPVSFVAPAGE